MISSNFTNRQYLVGASVVRRDLPPQMGSVQLRVGVGGVAVATPPRREHHVAPINGALVHLSQMHRREVDLQGSLVAEGLEADVALHALLAGGGADEADAETVAQLLLHLLMHRVAAAATVAVVAAVVVVAAAVSLLAACAAGRGGRRALGVWNWWLLLS